MLFRAVANSYVMHHM